VTQGSWEAPAPGTQTLNVYSAPRVAAIYPPIVRLNASATATVSGVGFLSYGLPQSFVCTFCGLSTAARVVSDSEISCNIPVVQEEASCILQLSYSSWFLLFTYPNVTVTYVPGCEDCDGYCDPTNQCWCLPGYSGSSCRSPAVTILAAICAVVIALVLCAVGYIIYLHKMMFRGEDANLLGPRPTYA